MKSILGLLIVLGSWPCLAGNQINDEIGIRIVGGENAELGEYPSTVSVQVRSRHWCGGTLIAEQWILSAAHCYDGSTPNQVLIGAVDLLNEQEGEVLKIEEVILHPDFGQAGPISADFALIKLEKPVENHPIAKLNNIEPDDLKEAMFTVVGWGSTLEGSFGSPILQKVDVPLVPRDKCNQQIKDFNPNFSVSVDDLMFCAGYDQGGKDACQGDSGGPIYMWDDASQSHILMGVVSWGIGCARPNLSGIYSDISEVREWIDSVIIGERFLNLAERFNF